MTNTKILVHIVYIFICVYLYIFVSIYIFVCIRMLVYKPGEKIEFSFLMHEINVLTNWTTLVFINSFLLRKLKSTAIRWFLSNFKFRVDTLIRTGNVLFHIQLFYLWTMTTYYPHLNADWFAWELLMLEWFEHSLVNTKNLWLAFSLQHT